LEKCVSTPDPLAPILSFLGQPKLSPTEEVALELYVRSGNVEGHDLDNWLEAESIVWDDIEQEMQCTLELRT